MWCEVLLSKLQRLLCLPLPYELNQSLLLQVEGELVILLKDLHDGRDLDKAPIYTKLKQMLQAPRICIEMKKSAWLSTLLQRRGAAAYLWIEVIDALDGLLHIAALHCLADLHAVCDGCQVNAWLCQGLLLKRLSSLHISLFHYRASEAIGGDTLKMCESVCSVRQGEYLGD